MSEAPAKKPRKPRKENLGRAGHPAVVRWAVLAALLSGDSQERIAQLFDIDQGTVSRWKKNLREELGKLAQEQREQVELNIFITILKTQHAIQSQLDVFSDTQWLKRQPAEELGILHGILHDKSIRLLEALTPAEDGNADSQGPTS